MGYQVLSWGCPTYTHQWTDKVWMHSWQTFSKAPASQLHKIPHNLSLTSSRPFNGCFQFFLRLLGWRLLKLLLPSFQHQNLFPNKDSNILACVVVWMVNSKIYAYSSVPRTGSTSYDERCDEPKIQLQTREAEGVVTCRRGQSRGTHRSRDGGDNHKPKSARTPEAGRRKERSFRSSKASERSVTLLTPWFLTPGLQNCERVSICCVKPPSSQLVVAALEHGRSFSSITKDWFMGPTNQPTILLIN